MSGWSAKISRTISKPVEDVMERIEALPHDPILVCHQLPIELLVQVGDAVHRGAVDAVVRHRMDLSLNHSRSLSTPRIPTPTLPEGSFHRQSPRRTTDGRDRPGPV